MTMFLGSGRNHWRALLIVPLVLCIPAWAQQTEKDRAGRDESAPYRTAEPSDLTKDNLNRVAASAAQIQGVLLKDAGLLVELKRWVAKEATDSGQIVEDASLTDQAIFERLDRDVVFRSVATRLLQRYGYLIPTANPDSDYAKEQEFVLKERARRLVQIEAQEDAGAPRNEKRGQEAERTGAACDPREDEDCTEQPRVGSRRKARISGEGPGADTNPPAQPERQQSQPRQRTLQAGGQSQKPSLEDGLGTQQPGFEVTTSSLKRGVDSSGMESSGPGLPTLGGAMAGGNVSSLSAERANAADVMSSKASSERPSRSRSTRGQGFEEDMTPVRMVHRANPYADIPSLYDMYVQAAVRQK